MSEPVLTLVEELLTHSHQCVCDGKRYTSKLTKRAADHIDEAHKLLKEVEWCGSWNSYKACSFCHSHPYKGHKPTCRLKLFLEGHK